MPAYLQPARHDTAMLGVLNYSYLYIATLIAVKYGYSLML